MSAEVILGVDGISDEEQRLALISSLYKYSGVLDVNVTPGDTQVRVRYDADNILARDIKDTIEGEGLEVNCIIG